MPLSLPASLEIPAGSYHNLSALGQHYRLIDVREDSESSGQPIFCDYRLPFSRFNPSQIKLAHEAPLLVLCEQGWRSRMAASLLRQKGWRNAFSLQGGLQGLRRNDRQSDPALAQAV